MFFTGVPKVSSSVHFYSQPSQHLLISSSVPSAFHIISMPTTPSYIPTLDIMHLTKCADAVARWHLENGLLLNASKTEALITGSRQQISNINCSNLPSGLSTLGKPVSHSSAVRLLGITIDRHLNVDDGVTKIIKCCNYHIRSLQHIRRLIDTNTP